ncbi:hypothetical protein D9757_000489 [Collybiopsis confluens]|uniref:Uncharacterized protein n=1 Tax=Collybiopsis confluens TaxID=2823264 RepID=A0A8H5I1B0_9AGAR|nr:hypothetical protein D9757_000489 [Collybiopsis confluens]
MLDLRLLYYAEGARTTLLTGLPPSLHPFVPFASRMRSLTFRFRCSDTVYSFLHHISPHLPALESLELDLKIISEEHCHYPDSVFAFSTSTKLQSLKVNVDRGELLNFISFPSDQLTSFELVYEAIGRNWYFDMKADALLNMLSGFDNLIDCKINCPDRIVESSSSNSTVVILQHLRSLELHVEDQSWINPTGNYWHILSALKTPSLESLHLHHQDHEDSPAYSYFGIFLLSDFQKRSQAPISDLTLSGVPFCSRDELMTVLGNFSSVTRLSYLCGDFDIGILMDVLRCREGHEPLLPGLNYLAFDLLSESIHRINCIGDLLDSRWWPREEAESETPSSCTQRSVSRLEHIHIGKIDSYCFTSLYGFSPEVQRRIDACRKQGLRLDNCPYSLKVAKGMDCTIS